MKSITYTTTMSTMGDNITDAEADRYTSALADALVKAFPGAEITVKRDDRMSCSQIHVSSNIEFADVHAVANNVWDSGDWC